MQVCNKCKNLVICEIALLSSTALYGMKSFDNFNHSTFNFYFKVLLAFCGAWSLESRRKWSWKNIASHHSSVQSLSRVWLCDPMDCSTPGLPVHHQLPESTQTHVHWVGDAIQLSHPLSSPSPPALNLSQHQGLFKYGRNCKRVTQPRSYLGSPLS